MTFKEWLKKVEEVSTSTADVAHFARPVMGGPARMYPPPITFKKNKNERKKENM